MRRAIRHGFKLGQRDAVFLQARRHARARNGRRVSGTRHATNAHRARDPPGRRALCGDPGAGHGLARYRDRRSRRQDARFRAKPCSSSTTRSASRSTSPTTLPANAATASMKPGSRRPWMRSARGPVRRASSASIMRADMSVDTQTSFVGYDGEHGVGRIVALFSGNDAVTELHAGADRAGGARRHAVLCRERWPGWRPRRARDTHVRASK